MKILLYYTLLILSVIGLACGCAGLLPVAATYASAAATVTALIAIARFLIMPRRAAMIGIDLLKSCDTNNRIAHTGQPDADRIADLFNDMMGRLREERLKVQEKERLLGYLIEASPMGVVIFDFDHRISVANSAFLDMADIDRDSVWKGKSLTELDSPLTLFASELGIGEVSLLRLPDGGTLKCSMLAFTESGFERRFLLVENVTREIDQARREAYGQVIRIISHEVNNSMGGVRSLLEMLAGIHADDAALVRLIESVAQRCAELSDFIGGYADVIRLRRPELTPLSLPTFIADSLPFLESSCRAALHFHNPSEEIPCVDADGAMLSQALVNIIKNADESIASSPDASRGQIHISLARDRSTVSLTITDNGLGISKEHSRKIFTPFFSSKPDGQGIGLTLTSEILRRHNCSFTLRTDPDGLTRFRIIFPAFHAR